MKYLVDTNVISEAQRSGGHPSVRAALVTIPDAALFSSVIVFGEIISGLQQMPAGRRKNDLLAWFASVERRFSGRVLPVDIEVSRVWGGMTAAANIGGRPLSPTDGLIAATPLVHGLTVLTRNVRDFEPTGVAAIDPITLA